MGYGRTHTPPQKNTTITVDGRTPTFTPYTRPNPAGTGQRPYSTPQKNTAVTVDGRTAKFVSYYNSLLSLPHPSVIAVPYLGNSGKIAVNLASV